MPDFRSFFVYFLSGGGGGGGDNFDIMAPQIRPNVFRYMIKCSIYDAFYKK